MSGKILITGATGFLGTTLCKKLIEEGESLIPLSSGDGSILEPSTFDKFKNEKIKHIYHLAGKTYVPESWDNPPEFIDVNTQGTSNMLEFARKTGSPVTYANAYIYGIPGTLPITEKPLPSPNNPYALSKYLGEQVCMFYAGHFGIPVTVLRIFNIYGPGQNEKFVIPTLIRQALFGKEVAVRDLLPKRDYVYIDDVVAALSKSRINCNGYSVYNVASGYSYSVKEIIEMIFSIRGIALPVRTENSVRKNEIPDTVADISHAMKNLNWKPVVSIMDGLKTTIDFYLKNKHSQTS